MEIMEKDTVLTPVPSTNRQHWMVPAIIFAGLEFAVPVLMVGSSLAGHFSLIEILLILFIGLVVFQWVGNALQGYLGAKTGRPSSVIARTSFGAIQARFVVGLALIVLNVGWFGVNTAVAGNAISALLGVEYNEQWLIWAFLAVLAGLLFALPSVIGYSSMKWTDYLAVPAGLVLITSGVIYALKDTGWETLTSWNPEPSISFFGAVSIILGANVAQWLIASDYTRYSKPRLKDQALIPLGIVVIGLVFFFTGAVMSVGIGDADIVNVMKELGYPFWGFLILYIALWTSQIIASYSIGLAAANMFNIDSGKGRAFLTFLGAVVGISLALMGILSYFLDFLILLGVIYPAIAGVMFADFFFIRKREWEDKRGWNWIATIAFLLGGLLGYLTQYQWKFGIPAVQSLVISAAVYLLGMRLKARLAPDQFTKVETGIAYIAE